MKPVGIRTLPGVIWLVAHSFFSTKMRSLLLTLGIASAALAPVRRRYEPATAACAAMDRPLLLVRLADRRSLPMALFQALCALPQRCGAVTRSVSAGNQPACRELKPQMGKA